MARGNILKEIFMKDRLRIKRDKVMEFITTKMVLDMKVNGQKVYRMVQVK